MVLKYMYNTSQTFFHTVEVFILDSEQKIQI